MKSINYKVCGYHLINPSITSKMASESHFPNKNHQINMLFEHCKANTIIRPRARARFAIQTPVYSMGVLWDLLESHFVYHESVS